MTLPKRIEELEIEQHKIQKDLADPAFYRESGNKVANYKARLEALELGAGSKCTRGGKSWMR